MAPDAGLCPLPSPAPPSICFFYLKACFWYFFDVVVISFIYFLKLFLPAFTYNDTI